jgi:all-trans-retinol 13,14-reductase
MSRYDTVVIGAGVSGMTAALLMAKYGKRVALLESNHYIGPLLRRFKRSGVWCDPGFHYSGGLSPNGILQIMFNYLGLAGRLEPYQLRPDNFDTIQIHEEAEYHLPYGLDAFDDYLSSRFPDSRAAIGAYIQKLEEIQNSTAFMNPDIGFMQQPSVEYANCSLSEFLNLHGAETGLIRLLGEHGMALYGVDGDEIPLSVHSLIMGSFYRSAHIISGGGDAIVNAFKTELEAAGVDVLCDTKVSGFRIDEQRRLQAVQTMNETELLCEKCISTIHPQLLVDMLPADRIRPAFINRIKRKENTFAPFILFYKVQQIPERVAGGNYYIFPSSPAADRTRDYMAVMGIHPACESAGQKALSVISAWPAQHLETLFNGRTEQSDSEYQTIKYQLTGKITAQLFHYLPELKNHCRIVETATPLTYNRYTGTIRGSIYGLKQSVRQSALTSHTPVHGLYMAGQSVQCGIMGAMISSFMAACQILDPEKIRSDLNSCR